MATGRQITGYANGLIAMGVVPGRTTNGQRLAEILVQGYSNEHDGMLPSSPEAFVAWAAAPYWQNSGLRRHWPAGSRDQKTDGTSQPPPWDWNPMGCPPGGGCNLEDWQNRSAWPDPAYNANGEAGAARIPAVPIVRAPGQTAPISIPPAVGELLQNPVVLLAGAAVAVMLLR